MARRSEVGWIRRCLERFRRAALKYMEARYSGEVRGLPGPNAKAPPPAARPSAPSRTQASETLVT